MGLFKVFTGHIVVSMVGDFLQGWHMTGLQEFYCKIADHLRVLEYRNKIEGNSAPNSPNSPQTRLCSSEAEQHTVNVPDVGSNPTMA